MPFTPTFDDSYEGYVHNHLKRNFWKVASSMTYDDVLQEARFCTVCCHFDRTRPGRTARPFGRSGVFEEHSLAAR